MRSSQSAPLRIAQGCARSPCPLRYRRRRSQRRPLHRARNTVRNRQRWEPSRQQSPSCRHSRLSHRAAAALQRLPQLPLGPARQAQKPSRLRLPRAASAPRRLALHSVDPAPAPQLQGRGIRHPVPPSQHMAVRRMAGARRRWRGEAASAAMLRLCTARMKRSLVRMLREKQLAKAMSWLGRGSSRLSRLFPKTGSLTGPLLAVRRPLCPVRPRRRHHSETPRGRGTSNRLLTAALSIAAEAAALRSISLLGQGRSGLYLGLRCCRNTTLRIVKHSRHPPPRNNRLSRS